MGSLMNPAVKRCAILMTALFFFFINFSIANAQTAPVSGNADATSTGTLHLNNESAKNFWARWGDAYLADWSGHSPGNGVATTTRRGTPPPLSSPPFPASDYPIGGTPLIGAPDTQTYMLQQAINGNVGHNKIYGWIDIGGNASTNNRGNTQSGAANVTANAPLGYDAYPNTVVLDQIALYFERLPDTAQHDHFDWGYRVTPLYGEDYRYTTARGMLSQQLLARNQQYGFDPVMMYMDFYIPKVAQGMDIRVGRYISLPDIEAQLAPNNYTYSHSILYVYDCYTQTGVNVTVKVNDHLTVQGGFSAGCETMPWAPDARPTGDACVVYTWHNGGDVSNTCDNTIDSGKYGYNNLTAFYETWYHRINATWHTDTEGWYQYMKDTPNMFAYYESSDLTHAPQTAAQPWPEINSAGSNLNFGAVCVNPLTTAANRQPGRCYAPEWAVTNYVEHSFAHNQASLNIRNELVNDIRGQRTGTPGYYEEHMVGLDLWVGSTVTFRPELSYIHSYSKYGLKALDISPGTAVANAVLYNVNSVGGQTQAFPWAGKTQALVLSGDVIWHF
jgi:hypothetical protein